ncbi:hypothetical protein [Desulfoluna spongiiphila]|uniref:Uncharacterized protein n=1 Tax=Desulfoluna spongiiphila TaxID=419481 RepID=A0A1G5F8R9_9BACT|nr:hypothetical protein [Desulfoluna spongiiphila]SCY35564.1 hypothetical protein SAMN05216233_107218 [Desulfoluna spongiiphila]
MRAKEIVYPVLCFSQGVIYIAVNEEALTTCNANAIKKGWFKKMVIVAPDGMKYTVSDARKIHGVGPFWGYNIFLNQKVKVGIDFEGKPSQVNVYDVKKLVEKSLESWDGWVSSGSFNEIQEKIKEAKTIKEIVDVLYSEQCKGNSV